MNIEKFTADVRAFDKNIKINSGYIALSDLKTLETLLKGADKLGDSFKKLYDSYMDADIASEEATGAVDIAYDKADDQKKKNEQLRTAHNKAEDKAEGVWDKLIADASKVEAKSEKAFNRWTKAKTAAENEQKQIGGYVSRFDSAIKSFTAKTMFKIN